MTLQNLCLAGCNVSSTMQIKVSHLGLFGPSGVKITAVIEHYFLTWRKLLVSVSQHLSCVPVWPFIVRYGNNKDTLHLEVILISNTFSFTLFQAILYYIPSLGIQMVSSIVKKRAGAGGGRSMCWRLYSDMEMLCLNSKGAFFFS